MNLVTEPVDFSSNWTSETMKDGNHRIT